MPWDLLCPDARKLELLVKRVSDKNCDLFSGHLPPALEVRPTVGLIPTRLFLLLGDTIDPSVSLPSAAAARPILLPIPLPELEPDGSAPGK